MRAGGLRRPRRVLRAWRSVVVVISVILMLALCAGAAYALGIVEDVGFSAYRNTSPPLAVSAGGVTLAVAHSRYLILDAITVTLTNHSGAPIYLLEFGSNPNDLLCGLSGLEYQSADGWQSLGGPATPCWFPPVCPSGMARFYTAPAVGVVASGQTVVLYSYDGQDSYPPLPSGAYRFSMEYSPTPVHGPWTSVLPDSVTLWTQVTLTSAWWIPPWYHHSLDCPTSVLPE